MYCVPAADLASISNSHVTAPASQRERVSSTTDTTRRPPGATSGRAHSATSLGGPNERETTSS